MYHLFIFAFFSIFLSSQSSLAGKVLVYRGTGGGTSSAQAAADVVESLGHKVEFVSPSELEAEVFEDAIMWVQPAGNAIKVSETIGAAGLKLIRNFVSKGGHYVGFCAGAFLADKFVDDALTVKGLGIIPIETADYPVFSNDGLGTMVWINWNGKMRHVFFNGGGTFYLHPQHPVKVIAYYGKDILPATIQTTYGKGNVVVTGAHPEAPEAWKSKGSLKDKDGIDHDLAKEMVLRALSTN